MRKDNHYGPMFEEIKKKFPSATRFHWHVNCFREDDRFWMVGTPSVTEDLMHSCMVWENVRIEEILA